MKKPTQNVFITGFNRSGTTLVDKLVHNLSDTFILSQPFRFLFLYFKVLFYQKNNINEKLPLNHLFFKKYKLEDFYRYLSVTEFEEPVLVQDIVNATTDTGIYTPETFNHFNDLLKGDFLNQYNTLLANIVAEKNETLPGNIGSKEVLSEEYIPYLMDNGFKVVLIIRDPRDTLCSLNFGKGIKFTSRNLPTIFNLRQWRKSVAFALNFKKHSNLKTIFYEDLLNNPKETTQNIADFIGNEQIIDNQFFEKPLLDQDGKEWRANSSFNRNREESGSLFKGGINQYLNKLKGDQIKSIESFCYPELKAMGYSINFPEVIDKTEDYIEDFIDPFFEYEDIEFFKMEKYEEVNRIKFLKENKIEKEEKESYFIFPAVYDSLKM